MNDTDWLKLAEYICVDTSTRYLVVSLEMLATAATPSHLDEASS